MAQFNGRQSENVRDLRGVSIQSLLNDLHAEWQRQNELYRGNIYDRREMQRLPSEEEKAKYEAVTGKSFSELERRIDEIASAPPNMSDRELDRSVYREPGYQPNYRNASEILARDMANMKYDLDQRVEAGQTTREQADKIIEQQWDNLKNQIQVDLDNGVIDPERAGGIVQRIQTGGPFDPNIPSGTFDNPFPSTQGAVVDGAANFAAFPHNLPAIGPPSQTPVDPHSLDLQRLPGVGPQIEPLPNSQNYGEDNDYLFGDEANPTRRNGVQSISADEREIDRSLQEMPQETIGTYDPPDMAGAFAGGEQLSPKVVQTIIAESLGEGPEGMRLVAETIMNRARERGITPEQVVMEKGQYAPHSPQYAAGSAIDLDSPKNIAAATAAWGAAQSAEDPTLGAEFFNVTGTKAPSAGERLQPVWEHGKHTFWNDTSGVKVMQQNLKAAGLYDGEIDGDFGPATKAAADAFRAQLGTDDPMQALTSLGVEPAVGQEAITNILQSPESLPAFGAPSAEVAAAAAPLTDPRLDALRQRMETDPAALQEAMATTPLPDMGGQPLPDVLQAQAPPASGAGVDATGAPVDYAGDYNDILDAGAPTSPQSDYRIGAGISSSTPVLTVESLQPGSTPEAAGAMEMPGGLYRAGADYIPGPGPVRGLPQNRTGPSADFELAPQSPAGPDRSDLTQAGPRYDPLNPQSAATPPPMAGDPYADFETTRANVQSPQTLRDMMGQAGFDDSQWAATDLGIPSQSVPPSSLPPLMQQQYEQEALRDWARPQAPEEAAITPQSPLGDPRLEQMQEQQGRTFAPYNAPAEAATAAEVRERLTNLQDPQAAWNEMQREMGTIAGTQPIGPPESRNYRIGQGLRPDAEALQTAAIGGPDAPPPMATANVVPPSPQATADIGLTAMPPAMSSDAIFAPSEITPQQISDIERQRANPPAGGIRGWTYDQNGRVVAVGAPTASVPAPAPAAAVAPEAPAASTGTHGAPTGAGSFRTVGNFKAGVDPQLMQAAEQAAVKMGYQVEAFSGKNPRKGTENHPSGQAIDVRILDPATGQPLGGDAEPDMRPDLFETYEKYAQGVYHEANVIDPSGKLADKMRWGGYFVSGGTPMDIMHIDVNMAGAGPTAAGNFKTGLKPEYAKAWGVDPALAQRGITDPERVAEVLMAPSSATQQTMLSTVDNSGQLLKMAQAADDAGANNIEAVGGTVRVWQDAARTISGDWEQIEAVAAAGGPGVSIDYAQGVLSVAPVGPQATTSATTATEPTQPTAAAEAAPAAATPAAAATPTSTMRDVARAASAAGVHHISVDPATNVMTGYNNNKQPWTSEQQAQIAAAVPGITVDAGGMRITPAPTTGLTDYDPNATTGTTTAVEAKPGGVQTTPVAEAAVPISPAPDAPPNMSAIPDAVQSQPTEGAAGLPNTGPTAAPASLEALVEGAAGLPMAPNMVGGPEGAAGLPNTGPGAAPASLQAIGNVLSNPPQLNASGLPETQPGAQPGAITTSTATPPVVGATAPAPSTEPRVQLTAPAGATTYNTMEGPVVIDAGPLGPDNLGVIDAGPRTSPLPPVMTGKEKDDYLGPTQRMVTTVPLAPGDVAQPLRPGPGVELGPANVVPMPYAFTPPPMTGKEEDDYIGPALLPPAPAPAPAPEPPPQLPADQYVTPSVATPAVVAPPPKESFQEKTEKASGRSKTFSDPIEYAARNSVTEDGKFDHDKFWEQLGDVDLNQTQQTIAAKTAAQGHFTQNKMPNFLSGLNMPDMGGMTNMLGGIGNVASAIPNPVNALSNLFGGLFGGGGFDPRSQGIGSDSAASQGYGGYSGGGNYAGGSLSGGGYGSSSFGGSYSGPGSYNGGGGSQYGSGFGGGGGYGGAGTYGGAGGANIGSGVGGAYRNR